MQLVIKIQRILTYSLALIPLIPQRWVAYLIAVWGIFSLFLLNLMRLDPKKIFWALLLSSPFFLLLIQAWVSQDKTDWFAVEKAHSFWVFPLCFIFLKKDVPPINQLVFHRILAYSMATLAIATSLYFLIFRFKITAIEQHDFIFRYRNEINHLIHIHPSYLSLMTVYSLLFFIHSAPKFSGSLNRVHLFISAILLAFIYFLSARLVWIAGAISLIFLILLSKEISAHSKRWILVTLSALLIVMIATNPRIAEFITFNQDNTSNNTLKVRSVISRCSISLIPEALPFGLGASETQKKLNACYGNEPVFKIQTFNTHNQYLDFLISLGIPGLLFLLSILISGCIVVQKNKNLLFLAFLILTSIIMLGENILSRQSGVVFFCMMFSLFIRQHILQTDEK